MKKDFLHSNQLFLTDNDFDFENKNLTFKKSVSHESRFYTNEKNLKNNENIRKNEIS